MTAGASGTSSARRVVVAEDEALIRLDVVEMLRDAGYDVVGEAGDGEQAVRLAQEHRPDLVVLDVKMPVLDGISAAERIAGAGIAPVVLLTAFSQRELVERARDAGAMAYVVKPFTAADLLPALEIAVSRHQEIKALEAEVADLTDRFETRKVVDRAKGLLQARFGMSEPEAFRWIQKTSMDKRLTMREVASAVVASAGPPAPGAGAGGSRPAAGAAADGTGGTDGVDGVATGDAGGTADGAGSTADGAGGTADGAGSTADGAGGATRGAGGAADGAGGATGGAGGADGTAGAVGAGAVGDGGATPTSSPTPTGRPTPRPGPPPSLPPVTPGG